MTFSKALRTLVLTFVLLCLFAGSALAYTEGKWTFDVEDGGAIIVSYGFDYHNPETRLTIPDKLGKYPVTGIGYNAFDGCYWLEEVRIPYGVTEIGWYAFANCDNLESVLLPYGVTSIGKYAFTNCYSLKSITLPDSLTQIYGHAFEGCTKLQSIIIPAGVERITNFTFGGCFDLKSIVIKGKKTQLYQHAFSTYMFNEEIRLSPNEDVCAFACWAGISSDEYSMSAELYAQKHGFTITYFSAPAEEQAGSSSSNTTGSSQNKPSSSGKPSYSNGKLELPPPKTSPVVTSYEEYKKLPQESQKADDVPDMPIFIQSEAETSSSKVTDSKGKPYEGKYVIKTEMTKVENGAVDIEISSYDAYGNKLKWNGKAKLLLTYKDIELYFGIPASHARAHDIKIRHTPTDGPVEYFSTREKTATFTSDGVIFEVTSLSPFRFNAVAQDVDLPETGDSSLPLVFLFTVLALSVCAAAMLKRRHA